MVTYCATKLTATYSPMIGQFVDTMMLLSTVLSGYNDPSNSKCWKLFPVTLLLSAHSTVESSAVVSRASVPIAEFLSRVFTSSTWTLKTIFTIFGRSLKCIFLCPQLVCPKSGRNEHCKKELSNAITKWKWHTSKTKTKRFRRAVVDFAYYAECSSTKWSLLTSSI